MSRETKREMQGKRKVRKISRTLKAGGFILIMAIPIVGHCDLSSTAKNAFFPNMVKIRSVHKAANDERGFGLIMLEKDGYLYIATPKHVVTDEEGPAPAESISVTFYQADESVPARLERQHAVHDIALLRVRKPVGFNWNYAKLSDAVAKGNSVFLLGYDWRWQVQPHSTRYEVTYVSSADIEISAAVKVNMSGGLVVTDKGIAGMIVADNQDEQKVIAFRLDFLADIVLKQWLAAEIAELAPRDDYPFVAVDGSAYLSFLLTSLDEDNLAAGYGNGIGVDYVWSPKLGVRFAHFDGRVKSDSEFALTNQSAEFRNDVKLNMIYLLFGIGNELSRTPYVREKQGTMFGYVGLGVGKHDPQLNINKAGSRRLNSFSQFEGKYDDDFRALALGMRSETRFNRYWSGGFDFGLTFTDTEYLGIDVDDPFSENKSFDFMININFYLSLSFGKAPTPVIKALY